MPYNFAADSSHKETL